MRASLVEGDQRRGLAAGARAAADLAGQALGLEVRDQLADARAGEAGEAGDVGARDRPEVVERPQDQAGVVRPGLRVGRLEGVLDACHAPVPASSDVGPPVWSGAVTALCPESWQSLSGRMLATRRHFVNTPYKVRSGGGSVPSGRGGAVGRAVRRPCAAIHPSDADRVARRRPVRPPTRHNVHQEKRKRPISSPWQRGSEAEPWPDPRSARAGPA